MLTRTVGTDARADQRHMWFFFGLMDMSQNRHTGGDVQVRHGGLRTTVEEELNLSVKPDTL